MNSYPATSLAAVLGPAGIRTSLLEAPLDLLGGGLLRVEAAAVCGSDVNHYGDTSFRQRGDVVLGHETAGSIVALADDNARKRWGVELGDRVYVEEFIGCKVCSSCVTGSYNLCPQTDWRSSGSLRYGRTPVDVAPGLWGGFSQYLYLHPNAILHPLPDSLPSDVAVLANPVANGMRWLHEVARLRAGERVLIVGPGPHGLGCVIAARQLASEVRVVGLPGDEGRLRDAHLLGADHTHAVEDGELSGCFQFSDGLSPNVVVDLTPSDDVLSTAITAVESGGRIVLAGHKPKHPSGADFSRIARKELRVLGVSGPTYNSVRAALKHLDRNVATMKQLDTKVYGIEDAERALRAVSGDDVERPTHAIISG